MKLLVTGGAGYIGSASAHQLIQTGHEVVVVDNLYSGHRWTVPESAEFIEGDIGNSELLQRVFSRHKFDGVLHFAAHVEVAESVADPLKYYRNNTMASLTLFEACRRAKVSQLIFSSTAAVYGESEGVGLLHETSPVKPMSPYGQSKLMTERMLEDLGRAAGDAFRYVILRYFNAAGARRDLKVGQCSPRATHLIKVAIETALGLRETLTVNGGDYPTSDGTCLRDYIHIEDLAQAHIDALAYLEGGGRSEVFNVGYGRPSSVLEVLRAIERVSQRKLSLRQGPRRPGDPSSVAADNTKARRVLGWEPKHDDLDLICKTAFDWEKLMLSRNSKGKEWN